MRSASGLQTGNARGKLSQTSGEFLQQNMEGVFQGAFWGVHMSCSLNSLKWGSIGDYIWEYYWGY